jgi:hypothetical protein
MDQQIDWQAVRALAKLAALRAVKRQIQKEGKLRVSLIPACKLDALATLYLKEHRTELVAEAIEVLNTSPYFARWSIPWRL